MKISINGKLFVDSSLDYESLHKSINDNTYNSIGEAITSKLSDAVHHSQWYHHTPQKFDLVENFNDVQSICGDIDNMVCYMDSFNWSIMNKTELTADIYRFITHRANVIRNGFTDNFLPDHINLDHILNLIDWHFLLDCVCWFL